MTDNVRPALSSRAADHPRAVGVRFTKAAKVNIAMPPSHSPRLPANEVETAAAHQVMDLVRSNPSLSRHVHRLRTDADKTLTWRQVLAELTRIQLLEKGWDR